MRALGLLLVLLTSCGDSPLLNHRQLTDRPARSIGLISLKFSELDLPFTLEWSDGCPNLTESCSFTVEFISAPPTGSTLTSELWMPSMGHGSSPVEVHELGPLEWLMSDAFFIMPGHWQVKLKLTLPRGSTDEVILNHHL